MASPAIRRTARAVLENIGIPVGCYLALTAAGWPPVWALVGGAGVSVLVLAVQYARTRQVTTLGVLVLVRFTVGVAIALWTGDPRLELAKDFAITFLLGLAAAASLVTARPLIARIRRDIVPDPDEFDRYWHCDSGFRRLHRNLTLIWTAGLSIESVTAVALIYILPLTSAVIATSVLSPVCLLGLIGWTQYRAHRWTVSYGRSR
ncbi:VC0807 family protein [Nocardia sp. NPDC006044]|uniref:VC0807 family protein n=1 Tax=Nocardia sp. NPDC006044 TaxID=3364306 RepID=UPI0036CA55B7